MLIGLVVIALVLVVVLVLERAVLSDSVLKDQCSFAKNNSSVIRNPGWKNGSLEDEDDDEYEYDSELMRPLLPSKYSVPKSTR